VHERATTEEVGLRSWNVRAFLAAEAASAIGTWATIVAIWGYAAFEFDATAGDVAWFGIAFSLPPVLLGPVSGSTIDRFGPRRVLAGAKILGAVASLALLMADDFRSLAVLSALHGVGAAFALPALQSLPPRIVPARDLARTNAVVSLCDELAIVLGPVAAGVSIGAFGFRGAFVFDAATYLLGLVVLPLVQIRDLDHDPSAPPATWRDAFAGWRIVARTPILRRTVLVVGAVNLLYGTALLAEPLYVRDVLERSPSTFAALQTVFGVCLVAGGLVVAALEDRLATFGWVALGVGLSGGAAVVYLGTPLLPVAFVGVAIWGVCTAVLAGPSRTLLQRNAPEAVHGRVLATDQMMASACQLTGILVAGVLVGAHGVPTTVVAIGAFVVVVAAGLTRSHARRPTAVPVVDPAPVG
jgi:DHA3 family macrolide efflux protein-like MFS transporter